MKSAPKPTPIDAFPTATSHVQAETEAILLKHYPDTDAGEPVLQKNNHMQFLIRNMVQGFPQRYISQDASQPWLLCWILQSFSVLQVGMDPGNKQRSINTIMEWQHPNGGFGGGPGQAPHLLPTYAAVCALAVVGRPGKGGGWDQIDRTKMYNFFMSLKQSDGSFLVAEHAEVDVRGIYCLLVTATLLNIVTPELVEGTAGFIASCQTYEGGFSSSSQPYFGPGPTLLASPRPALGEAHGGYTYCALASWVLLQPAISASTAPQHSINVKNLVRWLVQMQGTEIELGGFKGRTNKLVDGCYSWWVGGSFAMLQALGVNVGHSHETDTAKASHDAEEAWVDVEEDDLFDRVALQEYILFAGQHPAGGLRDKPPKNADAYHTMYCLAGLSSAQHRVIQSPSRRAELAQAWSSSDGDTLRKEVFLRSLSWAEEEGASRIVGGQINRVNATHPVFNLTITHAEGIMAHFYTQTIPPKSTRAAGPVS